jgi:hypothetical protein
MKKNNLPRQLGAIKRNKLFWRRYWGRVEDLCKGSFSHTHLYFILSFALLYFYLHRYISKTQKN